MGLEIWARIVVRVIVTWSSLNSFPTGFLSILLRYPPSNRSPKCWISRNTLKNSSYWSTKTDNDCDISHEAPLNFLKGIVMIQLGFTWPWAMRMTGVHAYIGSTKLIYFTLHHSLPITRPHGACGHQRMSFLSIKFQYVLRTISASAYMRTIRQRTRFIQIE